MTKAVIIGSGIAGLLAARVASEFFEEVVVVERDEQPTKADLRKGVPQGSHIHVLLNKGEEILEELFPGFRKSLEQNGAVKATLGKDVKWYLQGRWMPPFEGGMETFFQSRPFLELLVREFVEKIDNVDFKYSTSLEKYEFDDAQEKIIGVRLKSHITGEVVAEQGDMFLDASGRGSRLLNMMSEIGLGEVAEKRVEVDFAYASAVYRLNPRCGVDWKAMLIYPKAPEETRAAAIVPVEGNQWLVTAAGYNGDHPPLDQDGFMDFLASLSQPDIHDALKDAELVVPAKRFGFKAGVRRYFEGAPQIPSGLLVIGDAICSANPFFGQGISVAAQEAKILQDHLSKHGPKAVNWSRRNRQLYYRDISKVLNISWGAAIGEDLKYPTTKGERSFSYYISRRLKDKIMASNDPEVAKLFYRVMHFAAPPTSLLTLKVFKALLFNR